MRNRVLLIAILFISVLLTQKYISFPEYIEHATNLEYSSATFGSSQQVSSLINQDIQSNENLILHFPLNGSVQDQYAEEVVSGEEVYIENNYDRPEWVDSPVGSGLRLDGFSTWIEWNQIPDHFSSEQLSIELWSAVESYPPENAPLINNYAFPDAGFYLGIEPLGDWYFAVSINGEWHTVWGDGPFPKNEWNHIGAVFDKDEGLKLYRNGELVGMEQTPDGESMTPDTENPIMIGRDIHTNYEAVFPTGVLNGIVSDIKIYNSSRNQSQINSTFEQGDIPGKPNLEVPDSRYADDPHRPDFHPIPPKHWANEPHGLVYRDGRYHMFYQHNPSGPYWAHMHWGHMSSSDLIEWEDHPIALAPEPGFDSYGVWSGDAVIDENNNLKVIYTGVDGIRAGIGLAEMEAIGNFSKSEKNPLFFAPPGNYEDFRDPFVWQDNGNWYMLIGSGISDGGGTALLYRSQDSIDWDFRGEVMGEGNPEESGEYWEMPMLQHLQDNIYYFGVTDLPIGRNTYWLGRWQNEKFTPIHSNPYRLDLINRFLSPAIERTPDGRIIAVGIIPNHVSSEFEKELGWAHTFSFPREWYYHEEKKILGQRPARELKELRGEHQQKNLATLGDGNGRILSDFEGTQFEMIADIDVKNAEQAGVVLRATPNRDEQTRIYYDDKTKKIVVDLQQASNNVETERDVRTGDFSLEDGERLKLHVFVDKSVIEVFVNDTYALATRAFPTSSESNQIDIFSKGGTASAIVDFWEIDPNYVSGEPDEKNLPDYTLHQNYPNPFNSSTTFSFDLPETTDVRLEVFNVLGQRIKTLVDEEKEAGTHQVYFNSSEVASGVYIYRMKADGKVKSKKMLLIK